MCRVQAQGSSIRFIVLGVVLLGSCSGKLHPAYTFSTLNDCVRGNRSNSKKACSGASRNFKKRLQSHSGY